jgi:hypothetical protein
MSIYVLAKKVKANNKRKQVNHVSPFYLNMTHTGRLITKCNSNTPTPAPQTCYGQYMKKKIRQFVDNRSGVTVKRMPNYSSSYHTANLSSKAIANEACCSTVIKPCYNNCSGTRGKATITKDMPYKSASWKIAKAKASRKCMCSPDNATGIISYERPIFGNRPGGCGSGYIL